MQIKPLIIVLLVICCLVTLGIIRELIDIVRGSRILLSLFVVAVCAWAVYALHTKESSPTDKY